MNCRDFESLIQSQMDERAAVSADVERAWESHGSACAPCRATASRYQVLRQVIAATAPPPAAPADFADRFMEKWDRAPMPDAIHPRIRAWTSWPILVPCAAAAVLFLVAWSGVRGGRREPKANPGRPVATEVASAHDPDELSRALAEATAATWDLARATSAPAARVGMEIIDADTFSPATLSLALPGDPGDTSDVLQGVGDRVNDGIRPLSGTALHAFGFLLGSPLAPADRG
jgi:hypothetical protein